MPDYLAIVADIALATPAFVGAYYALQCARLFRGDPVMERVWRLGTTAFAVVVFFSLLDIPLTYSDSALVQYHLVRIASVFAVAVFVVAVVVLVRWAKLPMESRTQLSP